MRTMNRVRIQALCIGNSKTPAAINPQTAQRVQMPASMKERAELGLRRICRAMASCGTTPTAPTKLTTRPIKARDSVKPARKRGMTA